LACYGGCFCLEMGHFERGVVPMVRSGGQKWTLFAQF